MILDFQQVKNRTRLHVSESMIADLGLIPCEPVAWSIISGDPTTILLSHDFDVVGGSVTVFDSQGRPHAGRMAAFHTIGKPAIRLERLIPNPLPIGPVSANVVERADRSAIIELDHRAAVEEPHVQRSLLRF